MGFLVDGFLSVLETISKAGAALIEALGNYFSNAQSRDYFFNMATTIISGLVEFLVRGAVNITLGALELLKHFADYAASGEGQAEINRFVNEIATTISSFDWAGLGRSIAAAISNNIVQIRVPQWIQDLLGFDVDSEGIIRSHNEADEIIRQYYNERAGTSLFYGPELELLGDTLRSEVPLWTVYLRELYDENAKDSDAFNKYLDKMAKTYGTNYEELMGIVSTDTSKNIIESYLSSYWERELFSGNAGTSDIIASYGSDIVANTRWFEQALLNDANKSSAEIGSYVERGTLGSGVQINIYGTDKDTAADIAEKTLYELERQAIIKN
jgi:hypothetical protein